MTTSTRDTAGASLEQHVEIETPEQVAFSYTVAGIGSRAAAALIDHAIIVVVIFGLSFLLQLVGKALGGGGTPRNPSSALSWALFFVILLGFAISWGYYVFFEAVWDGQTPGKRRMGIRVVQDGGYSVSFGASAVRNLVRVLDAQPGPTYAVGIVAAAISRSGKRLGDMVAGTFVVQERVVQLRTATETQRQPNEGAAPVTAQLSTEEYELLERFLERRAALDAERRRAIAEQLVERFDAHFPDRAGSPLFLLLRLFESEQRARARGVAARGATGAAREQHAIIAGNTARWSDFARALAEAQRRGLRTMSPAEVSALVAQYREVATDLARLRTASRGRDVDALFYVSRLVGAGHNLLYRQRALSARAAWRYVSRTVPREMRRSAAYILAAAAFLFGPMAITCAAVMRRPALATELLPEEMIDRANEGAARAQGPEARRYIDMPEFLRPVMAGAIIRNNVQITYLVFASGITAGVLTLIMLVSNGVSFGAAVALYASKGIFYQIGEFVIPHSVFELSAVCIAGGGALLIAAALLVPGARTRREALVINGRRAIRLITASTLLLLGAGIIEGNISPRIDIPLWIKWSVAGASALLLAFYVTRGRGAAEDEPLEENAYTGGYREARALISR